jgi:hypothetical protein
MLIIQNENYLTVKEVSVILNKGYQSTLRYVKLSNVPTKKLGREIYIKEVDIKLFFT